MKHLQLILCGLLITAFTAANAQLTIDAGLNRTICKGTSITLGGNPSAYGTYPPFSYKWQPDIGLSADSVARPLASPLTTTTYYVTVTDSLLNTAIDSVIITVQNAYYLQANVHDTTICSGQSIQLSARVGSNYTAVAACNNGTIISPPIGTDTLYEPVSVSRSPALFGNFARSDRNQLLYKANELQAIFHGPALISRLAFNIAYFNNNAQIPNFSIKMGLAQKDSLTEWENNLVEVYHLNALQPLNNGPWSMQFTLYTKFYWDGTSDLVIDICHNSPQTFGNQNNMEFCTNTPFKSYLYSSGSTDQCGTQNNGTSIFTRPNIKFYYCDSFNTVTPVNISGLTYNWTSASGTPTITNPTQANAIALPDSSETYFLQVSDNNSCSAFDTLIVHVNHTATSALLTTEPFCPEDLTGSISARINQQDTTSYWLTNANFTDTLFSGTATDTANYTFSNIPAGMYHLLIQDSSCKMDYPVTVSTYPAVRANVGSIHPIVCNGGTTNACVTVSGGVAPYTYLWDSVMIDTACYTYLNAGMHSLIVTDSNHCALRINGIYAAQPPPFDLALTQIDTRVILEVTGNTAPYQVNWGDGAYSLIDIGVIQHQYAAAGNYTVTLVDYKGCDTTFTITVTTTGILNAADLLQQIQLSPNPAINLLTVTTNGLAVNEIRIYNITGQLLSEVKQPQNNTIDISSLSNGVYIAEIKTKAGSAMRRWVKM